ncbi:hypothetical protein BESB_028300 [Besnoitia besnoiti]|uniref:HIT-type domain-containing protein n=1 Tax=Besnoitia besnoiti TaxID=94643 RepID=A0A2A9M095_BESBE|nr:uncharacterized protein BESB_028300 [Besnoitia besnoiti]PFH31395.1 hypothetical protein BESB_028300 [Besnoitia besnoiti]
MAQRSRQSPPAGTSRKRQHRDETDDEGGAEEESDKPCKGAKAEKKDKKEKKGLRSFVHLGEKKKWKKRREPLDINLIVAQDEIDKPDAPSWATLHAGPSALLPRRLCCCCGFPAKYRCPLCASGRRAVSSSTAQDSAARSGGGGQGAASRYHLQGRYVCSTQCLNLHQAHDCAPKHLLHWM